MEKVQVSSFVGLGLNKNIVRALSDFGYAKPFLIQEKCIPLLLSGKDVLGLAQTGSGKTAAFILPLLHNINPNLLVPQVLILAPTRELAIQLGEVCVSFAKYIRGVNVTSIYGGQKYETQFRSLKKGSQIIVGTPGRLLDHLQRSTLCLSGICSLVIDEADEMLRMGFIEDVRSIILKVPSRRQTALFSATFPKEIQRIACCFMKNPQKIYASSGTIIPSDIQQSYWVVSGFHKYEALMRFLEVEIFDAAIVFVRTKNATLEISKILEKNGYNSAALNGDMNQVIRQKTLDFLKKGQLDILIATDVAARGLDLERITLVVNYDAPGDLKSYIHRIGRTGRAGRTGRSLLFIKNSEYYLLRCIKKNNSLNISQVKVPSSETLIKSRLSRFSEKVKREWIDSSDLNQYRVLLNKIKPKQDIEIENLAAILLKIAQGDKRPLVISSDLKNVKVSCSRSVKFRDNEFKYTNINGNKKGCFSIIKKRTNYVLKKGQYMNRYRINIGKDDGIEVHHILGAIMNKGDVVTQYIGRVKLFSSHSIVELSKCIPENVLLRFTNMRILNKPMNIKFLGSVLNCDKSRFRKTGGL